MNARPAWTRAEAIARLRRELLGLCGDGLSMCRVAAARGIFCRGFRRWPAREFHDRWKNTLGVSTHLNREQMEVLADLWQLTEQLRTGQALICDAQTSRPGACRGWDEFSDEDLAGFCRQLLGRDVSVGREPSRSAQIAHGADDFHRPA